ncbi:hypothetical protein [Niveibacterium sp. SC-1]|uniref:BACON domain-containing protein n=1 Tax=Niveibacterium sp. SC-1 TaxID=3135646 RepID=UPI00311DC7ED
MFKRLFAVTFLGLLAACGGGGGGDDSAQGSSAGASGEALSFTPQTLSSTYESGTAPYVSVRAELRDLEAVRGKDVYVVIVDSDHVLLGAPMGQGFNVNAYQVGVTLSPTLAVGRHQGKLEIRLCQDAACSAQFAGSPSYLPYDLTVTEAAKLAATVRDSADGTMTAGGSAPPGTYVNVTGNQLDWTASTATSWLRVTSGTGTGAGQFQVSYQTAGMTPGDYTGSVTVSSKNGQRVELPFSLLVTPDAAGFKLLPSDYGVGFASTPTGSALSRTLHITDDRNNDIRWRASSSASWLKVTANGRTGADKGTLELSADPASLPNGAVSYATVAVRGQVSPKVAAAEIRVALWKDSNGAASMVRLPLNYENITADPIRPYIYASKGDTTVDVYNAYTGQKIKTIANAVTASAGAMAASPDGSRLFVLDVTTKKLSVIDLDTQAVATTWTVNYVANASDTLIAMRPGNKEVVLLGRGDAYTDGRSLGTIPALTSAYTPLSYSVSEDGRRLLATDSRISPATFYAIDLKYSDANGGSLISMQLGSRSNVAGSSNGTDVAVNADGSLAVTASGNPYACPLLDASTLEFLGYLPHGDAYPNNVEFTADEKIVCGISGLYASSDFWVHKRNVTGQIGYKVAGYARVMIDRQMVVTPDGLIVAALTNDPYLAFVAIGP